MNRSLNILLLQLIVSTFFLIFHVNCINNSSEERHKKNVQELKPWNGQYNCRVNEKFTTNYMRSRPPRMVKEINENWTFNYFSDKKFDEKPASIDYDDSKWQAIAIPHTWQNYETTRQLHPFVLNASEKEKGYFGQKMGIGNPAYWWNGWAWYRKKFEITVPIEGKRYFLEFDGVMKYCRVYLNGEYLGEHKGGFNSFYFEITQFLEQDKINTLTLAVRNKQDDEFRIPPMYSGNQMHPGGIYRSVRIVVKNSVYVPFQGSYSHEGGTFVTTPVVNKDSAVVNVKTWVKNDTETHKTVSLKTTLEDIDQNEICSVLLDQIIDPGDIRKFEQTLSPVVHPKLWSPDTPNLYKIHSYVYVNDSLFDHYESPLGFRTFTWDYSKNIGILNGSPVHIHGTNRTQAFPWLNNAIPQWIDILDISDIRFGLGHNFIRPSIHPNNLLVHDLFDQFGMLVNLSSPMIKDIDFSEDVQEQMMREAIRQHRNHPSIVFYSVGNETNDGADSKWVYEEDTTRIIHARKVTDGKGDYVTHDHTNMDMENLLRITIRGWTNNDVYPEDPVNGQHAGTEEWQHNRAIVKDGSIRGRIDMPNGVMWLYNDEGAARVYKDCPLKNINPKGWVDPYRIPKYMYFLWKANYTDEPMVFIHPHYWQSKYIATTHDFIADSNCDSIVLYVNQKKVGTQYPDKGNFYSVKFKDILVESGELKAIGKKDDKTVEVILPMAGKPERLRLNSSHKEILAKRNSIVAITVDVIDKKGFQVQSFNETLDWEVQGPASLIGPTHWQTDIHKNNADSGAWYISTPVINLIRSNGEPGIITVKVSSQGVKPATIQINSLPVESENTFVKQVSLKNEGRNAVEWGKSFLEPKVIASNIMIPIEYDLHLDANQDFEFYLNYLMSFLIKQSPNLIDYPVLKEIIAMHFSEHLTKNNGFLVADDFNFMVDRVNIFMSEISNEIDKKEKLADKRYLETVIKTGQY